MPPFWADTAVGTYFVYCVVVPDHTGSYHAGSYRTVSHATVPYWVVPHRTIPDCSASSSTLLDCAVLFRSVTYRIVPDRILPHYTHLAVLLCALEYPLCVPFKRFQGFLERPQAFPEHWRIPGVLQGRVASESLRPRLYLATKKGVTRQRNARQYNNNNRWVYSSTTILL